MGEHSKVLSCVYLLDSPDIWSSAYLCVCVCVCVCVADTLAKIWLVCALFSVQEYDFVFDIEVDDGGPTMRKLKLPYNKTGEWET